MVAITDAFRPHWEAEDEHRKIVERQILAAWVRKLLGAESSEPTVRREIDR